MEDTTTGPVSYERVVDYDLTVDGVDYTFMMFRVELRLDAGVAADGEVTVSADLVYRSGGGEVTRVDHRHPVMVTGMSDDVLVEEMRPDDAAWADVVAEVATAFEANVDVVAEIAG